MGRRRVADPGRESLPDGISATTANPFQPLASRDPSDASHSSKMPNTAASTLDYAEWNIVAEGEIRLETLPGTVTQWIGGY